MKTRAVIMAGGEGARLSVLTAKRAKPAVPFAGKYRIIDFVLSNCVNSGIYDAVVLAQYRPHSLIQHIGAGGPWDLNRDFTGGVRVYTPYRARYGAAWYLGTADAVQQNLSFIKLDKPDHVLILSADHIYAMDYDALITFHRDHQADLTMATVKVSPADAPRFGIVGVDENYRVTTFVEKPKDPPSNLANMGIYVFNYSLLDHALWEDHQRSDSSHDFGKDILPRLVAEGKKIYAYPYSGYWVDVGTADTYWQAHMDLLAENPPLDLNDRRWVIHTRTEERPPVRVARGAKVIDSMICDGCILKPGARVEHSVLSPGVVVESGALVCESIIFTDSIIGQDARVTRAIIDKRVKVGAKAIIGAAPSKKPGETARIQLAIVGKNSEVLPGMIIEPGATVATDVIDSDYPDIKRVKSGETVQTKRQPFEV